MHNFEEQFCSEIALNFLYTSAMFYMGTHTIHDTFYIIILYNQWFLFYKISLL